jgi:hypothetical protein
MSTARHILALLKSHVEGEDRQFYSDALQMAAHEARQGHGKLAQEICELIDQAKASKSVIEKKSDPIPLVQSKYKRTEDIFDTKVSTVTLDKLSHFANTCRENRSILEK